MSRPRIDAIDRFRSMYKILGNGCWQWTGFIRPNGYAKFCIDPKISIYAHRASLLLLKNQNISAGVVDHICRNRSCVNPDHLEIVSARENLMRGHTLARINADKKRCLRGHCFSEENTSISIKGHRSCKICNRNRMRRWRENQKASNAPRF